MKATIIKDFGPLFLLKNVSAHKVIENEPQLDVDHKNNLMLFHGTTVENSVGILREGFKTSEKGRFGRGLYLTACSDEAITYTDIRTEGKDTEKHCIFISEVLNSQVLKYDMKLGAVLEQQLEEKLEEHPFTVFESMMGEGPDRGKENFERDEKGRLYRFDPFCKWSFNDQYRVDARLVKPRYYLEFEITVNEVQMDKLEKHIEDNNEMACKYASKRDGHCPSDQE